MLAKDSGFPRLTLKTLVINTHLTYPGWSEGRLNRTFMDAAKAFFVERGHHVTETFVEHGYTPDIWRNTACRSQIRTLAHFLASRMAGRAANLRQLGGRFETAPHRI
jgi:hypothetical protein